ncbi:MAG: RluA family pseudouridine synthase [Akkermansiaceae bacterium]
MSLNILYQDEWIVAVDKPAGQLVHPADHPKPDDEVTMKILRDQLGQPVETIHRLDRPTTGVLLFGLCKSAAKSLRQSFEKQQVSKKYLALVFGIPSLQKWICETSLRKTEDSPSKSAITEFTKIESLGEDFSLIEARPKTGRFHQIRRHLLDCGHPIVGDYRYAGIERCDETSALLNIETRMLLQASEIKFPHPITGKNTTITAPLDPAFPIARNTLLPD